MPFSVKQREYFDNANKRWNFKTGATRSGKTYMDYYVIPKRIRARIGKPGLAVILGVTKSTIERNILEPMRNIWGTDLVGGISSSNICYLFGEKVYCLGAEKVSQVSKLRGSSIKYVYGDEVADWNEEVFEMLKSRLDKPYSCFDGALNPQGPNHWLKEFLDSEDLDIYCQKYTLFDNPFLDKGFVDSLCKEYAGSVYYKRYILGEWALSEGLVYSMFDEDKHVKDKHMTGEKEWVVSVDYGTVNPFAAGLWAFDGKRAQKEYEYYYDSKETGIRRDDETHYQEICKLIGDRKLTFIIVDPSAASFIETIKKHGNYIAKGAENDVLDGIRVQTTFLNRGIISYHEDCEATINEYGLYSWDMESPEDVVIKEFDHCMDSDRYYCYTFLRRRLRWKY